MVSTKVRSGGMVKTAARLGVCALALCGARAVAQEAPAPKPADTVGEEIVVTANKRAEKLSNIAGAVSVETGEDLDAANANGLRDYVGNLPNVTLQTNGAPGFGKVIVRGISSVTLGATTGTYIDEVPIGSSTMFAAGGFLTPDLDPADLDHVEVLKGPQGTLYGASAPGGLLKFVTKLPDTDDFSIGAEQEVSSVKQGGTGFSLRAHANVPIAKDVAGLRVSGFYRKDPGFIDNVVTGAKNENDVKSKGIAANLLLKPSERLSVRIGGLVQDINAHGVNGVAVDRVTLRPVFGKDDTEFFVPTGNRAKIRLISGTITYELTPGISLVSATSYSKITNADRADLTNDAPLPTSRLFNVGTKKLTQEVRLLSDSNQSFEWMVGGFYTKETSNRTSIFLATLPNGDPDTSFPLFLESFGDSKYREIAVFGNATYYFTPQLDLTLGARYAHNKQEIVEKDRGLLGNPDDPDVFLFSIASKPKDGVMTYSAALRWRFDEDSMVYARAASGYRPGGPRSIPLGVTPPPGFTDSFGAEKLWNYEVGLRTRFFDNRVNLSAAVYYIDWQSIQGFIQVGDAELLLGTFGNAGDAVSKGFEIELDARPVEGLSLGAAIGYSKATLERADPTFGAMEGDTLPYSPRWTVSLKGEYEHPISGDWVGYVGGNYRYLSKHFTSYESLAFTNPRQAIPLKGYGILDLRLGARSGNFDVTIFAKNVTDKYAYTADTTATFFGPAFESIIQPRTIGLSFSQNF
jgi:outer membrane receptor protein involved in Fe transport